MTVPNLALLTALALLSCSSSDGKAIVAGGGDAGPTEPPTPDGGPPPSTVVPIPGGETGIGFDDLRYSARLGRILVPGGWTGRVHLVDPETLEVTSVSGFTADASWTPGDDTRGVGPVVEGNGFVFAGDRTSAEVGVIDPDTRQILTKVALAGYPDYLGYVESTGELWVSQPFQGQIEILSGAREGNPVHDAVIPVAGGPESLVIDQKRGLALTLRLFSGEVVAIDVNTRREVGVWSTGCSSSHGIVAVDEQRGFLFPGCLASARAAVLDLDGDGAMLDSFDLGTGSTLVAYSHTLGHFYMRGDPGLPLSMLAVSDTGTLQLLQTFDSVEKAHCLTADDRRGIWACDWARGAIIRYEDNYPSSLK
jgi:hypothetical protein